MPTITYTASAADLADLAQALCDKYSYQDTINGSPNPETKAQFSRRKQIDEWQQMIVQNKRQKAIATAVAAVAEPTPPTIT